MINDIRTIADTIHFRMIHFIVENPNNKKQEDCENYVLNKLMQETKGHISPALIQQIIKFHRVPMEESGFTMEC